jgi:hypothetical protein
VPAPQHLADHLQVAAAPENSRGDIEAVSAELRGKTLQRPRPVPYLRSLEFLRVGMDEASVPGEVLHDVDQLDRGPVLPGQPGGPLQHGLTGRVAVDLDENVPETMHHWLPSQR